MTSPSSPVKRLPPWFRIYLRTDQKFRNVQGLVESNKLNTVCRSAACPNQHECWNAGTATFMILGNTSTRGCRFCNVPKGIPERLDREEPERLARAVKALNLKYSVITSVTRDDLADGGASVFAETIRAIRAASPECKIEVLIPDFEGSETSLLAVLDARPDVLNHNLETVPSLYPVVRPKADYGRSLELLTRAHAYGAETKTGIMLGFGEGIDELNQVMNQLVKINCFHLTLGQYLRPNKTCLPVFKYYHPQEFTSLREQALSLGFKTVVAGPLVRSSYQTGNHNK